MMLPLLTLRLRHEHDVVLARRRARQIAALLGLEASEQTRLATAVSELARNAFQHAGGGRVEFAVEPPGAAEGSPGRAATGWRGQPARPVALLVARVRDDGPGIADIAAVLEGRAPRHDGATGTGVVAARRLADRFHLESRPGHGTIAEVAKRLPPDRVVGPREVAGVAETLQRTPDDDVLSEAQRQNQELLRTLEELQTRQAEVERLNAELDETNRGVLALYAELDDRARDLKDASETKTRFLSEVSHELRTPLTSVLNLSRLLLDRVDGELTTEQERQVQLIRRSVETVTELVNDLLDVAKIEAGRVELRVARFTAAELLAGLRGMCRPLVTTDAVALVFDEPAADVPPLETDEGRLAQVLRNFVSNALKFTEAGEVRVSAVAVGNGRDVQFRVRDTGIGIAPADQARIFDDYVQVEHRLQRRARGTGLGLPLTRRLARLLGGEVTLASEPGVGSTFMVTVPARHPQLDAPAVTHG